MSLAHALAAQCPAQPRRAKDVEMQPGRVPGVGCRVWLGRFGFIGYLPNNPKTITLATAEKIRSKQHNTDATNVKKALCAIGTRGINGADKQHAGPRAAASQSK